MKFDFSGYATKNDLVCSDGRTIKKDAFKDNEGTKVPLVWQHLHNDPKNVIGHAMLENREDGVYAYCKLNNTEAGQTAKTLVEHKDVNSLSIHANKLVQKGSSVLHGVIREVSLVLSGANPGALIDSINITHSDGSVVESSDEAIIYTGLELEAESVEHQNGIKTEEKTVKQIFDSLTDEQKNVVYAMIADVSTGEAKHSDEGGDGTEEVKKDGTIEHQDTGREDNMKKNVFDKTDDKKTEEHSLTHAQIEEVIKDAQKVGSLKESILYHAQDYGIENIDLLFPDAKNLTNPPEWIKRDDSWVAGVLADVKKNPFSRIKSMAADITADEARARGYIKGTEKVEEVFPVLKRVTTPTTIYKKQKLDRDDIIDITDLNVVAWMKQEMRMMLNEEIARVILIGDGRDILDDAKVNEDNIRPIAFDQHLYAHKVDVAANVRGANLIETMIRNRKHYKGTGRPKLYTTDEILIDLLLVKDRIGRRLYNTEQELASALLVKEIVTVEVMETQPHILGIFANLNDYVLGADKGGEISMFDDFDIDFNQYKYLMETRISGALIKPKSALVFKRIEGDLVVPEVPTFDSETGIVTIPDVTGVKYFMDYEAVTAGAQDPIASEAHTIITAEPADGYYFAHNTTDRWEFDADIR